MLTRCSPPNLILQTILPQCNRDGKKELPRRITQQSVHGRARAWYLDNITPDFRGSGVHPTKVTYLLFTRQSPTKTRNTAVNHIYGQTIFVEYKQGLYKPSSRQQVQQKPATRTPLIFGCRCQLQNAITTETRSRKTDIKGYMMTRSSGVYTNHPSPPYPRRNRCVIYSRHS